MSDVRILVDSASLDVAEGQTVDLKATVVDSEGLPVEGARIEWSSANTDIAEVTRDGRLTAKQAGKVELTASAFGSVWDFWAWIRSLPKTIAIAAGDDQEGAAGETLPTPLTVRVLDRSGEPSEGIPVTFSVTSGEGSVSPANGVTDARGRVSAEWTLGQSGEQRVDARVHPDYAKVMSQSAVTFSAVAQEQNTEDPPVSPGKVTIAVPADTVLEIDATTTLTAVARNGDGILIEDATIEWSSSNPEIMTVDDMGRLVARAAGTVLITAAAAGCTSDTQRMVVEPPPVEATNPAAVTDLAVADVSTSSVTLEWTAVADGAGGVAKYAIRYGSPSLSWGSAYDTEVSVDADAVGEEVSYTYNGLEDATDYQFRLVSYRGTLNQGAIFGDYSNSVAAETEAEQGEEPEPDPDPEPQPDVASVTASPASHTFESVGQSLQIEATARNSDGAVVNDADFTWASTSSSVVSVNSMGLMTARGAGTAMIIVTSVCCGAADSVTVTVEAQAPPPSSGNAIFADGFESGDHSHSESGFRWADDSTPGEGSIAVVSERAHTGQFSLRFRWNGNSNAEQRFSLGHDYREIWFEWYQWIPTNYRHPGGSGTTNNKFFALWGGGGNAYADSDRAKIVLELWDTGNGDSRLRVMHNPEGGPTSHTTGYAEPFISENGPFYRGRWNRFRVYANVGTRGNSDGTIRVWVGDQLLYANSEVPIYPATANHPYFDNGYLMGYANGDYVDTSFYVDDFRVYSANPGW